MDVRTILGTAVPERPLLQRAEFLERLATLAGQEAQELRLLDAETAHQLELERTYPRA